MSADNLYLIEILLQEVSLKGHDIDKTDIKVDVRLGPIADLTIQFDQEPNDPKYANPGTSYLFPAMAYILKHQMEESEIKFQVKCKSPGNKLLGEVTIKWPKVFRFACEKSYRKEPKIPPETVTENLAIEQCGHLKVFMRFTAFGGNIQTQYQVLQTQDQAMSYLFKGTDIPIPFKSKEYGSGGSKDLLAIGPIYSERDTKKTPSNYSLDLTVSEIEANLCGEEDCLAAIYFKKYGIGPLAKPQAPIISPCGGPTCKYAVSLNEPACIGLRKCSRVSTKDLPQKELKTTSVTPTGPCDDIATNRSIPQKLCKSFVPTKSSSWAQYLPRQRSSVCSKTRPCPVFIVPNDTSTVEPSNQLPFSSVVSGPPRSEINCGSPNCPHYKPCYTPSELGSANISIPTWASGQNLCKCETADDKCGGSDCPYTEHLCSANKWRDRKCAANQWRDSQCKDQPKVVCSGGCSIPKSVPSSKGHLRAGGGEDYIYNRNEDVSYWSEKTKSTLIWAQNFTVSEKFQKLQQFQTFNQSTGESLIPTLKTEPPEPAKLHTNFVEIVEPECPPAEPIIEEPLSTVITSENQLKYQKNPEPSERLKSGGISPVTGEPLNDEETLNEHTKPKRYKSKLVYDIGETYPGHKFGHKTCIQKLQLCPWRNGWIWDPEPIVCNLKPRKEYRPGFIPKEVITLINLARQSSGLPIASNKPPKKKKKRIGRPAFGGPQSVTSDEYDGNDYEVEDKQTLYFQRKEGTYYVSVNPLRDPKHVKDNEDPYFNCPPLDFKYTPEPLKIRRSEDDPCDCCKCEPESDDELNLEFSPPRGVVEMERMKKDPNVVHFWTQYDLSDLGFPKVDANTSKTGSKGGKKKKGGKKGKK